MSRTQNTDLRRSLTSPLETPRRLRTFLCNTQEIHLRHCGSWSERTDRRLTPCPKRALRRSNGLYDFLWDFLWDSWWNKSRLCIH